MLLADFGFWPILIIWGLFALIGNSAKKKARNRVAPPGPLTGEGDGLAGELARALEELKRAELESARPLPADRAMPVLNEPRPVSGSAARPPLTRRVFEPEPVARGRRPSAPLLWEPDEAVVESARESRSSDDEAGAVIQRRLRGVDRGSASEGDLSAAQTARRTARVPRAIGGAQEHAEWHDALKAGEIGVEAADQAPGPRGLARYATGRLRDAMVLSEILGRPAADRS